MVLRKKIILAGISTIVLYYLTGLVLTLSGFVKSWPVFPGGPVIEYNGGNQSAYADDKRMFDNDGPYVFYQSDSLIVTSIVYQDTISTILKTVYARHEKAEVKISCSFNEHPDWNFTTTLHDSITVQPSVYPNVTRIAAISDIEGNFGALREWLINNKIIDSAYRWTFGEGHLVLPGDFFDRGTNVTECLWLIYDLEHKAKLAGGYVHFILGNHEIMNMSSDLRYVREKYLNHGILMLRPYVLQNNLDRNLVIGSPRKTL